VTLERQERSGSAGLRRLPLGFIASKFQGFISRARHSYRVRLLIFAALTLFLLWEVLTRSVAAYLADASPREALYLRSTNSRALVNIAEEELRLDKTFRILDPVLKPPRHAIDSSSSHVKGGGEQDLEAVDHPEGKPDAKIATELLHTEETYAEIWAMAEKALQQDPLNARAFRILGQISDRTTDAKQTEALMKAAIRRSLLDGIAIHWMIRKAFSDQDYGAALRYADTLLRTRPQVVARVMPMFGKLAEMPDASRGLKTLLATDPPWRQQFFSYFPEVISDARTPLEVLLSLKDTRSPPKPEELHAYMNFLIKHDFYDLAYYTWLQFLPPEQLARVEKLYNGNFDIAPSGAPFDWSLSSVAGVTIQIATRPDQSRGQALSLSFGSGRVDYRDVRQLVILGPGNYRFSGHHKSDLVSQRGLEWRVYCAGKSGALLGQSDAVSGSSPGWQQFEFSFTVPEHDCAAQYMSLVFDARSASERFISGSIWYDDLEIARAQ